MTTSTDQPRTKEWYLSALNNSGVYALLAQDAKEKIEALEAELAVATEIFNRNQEHLNAAREVSEVYEGNPILVYESAGIVYVQSPLTPYSASVRVVPQSLLPEGIVGDFYMISAQTRRLGTAHYGRENPRWSREIAVEYAKRWVAYGTPPE